VEPIVETALSLRGAPYRSGGADLDGFDCSGFTQYVFARFGVVLPRQVSEQFLVGEPIARDEVAAGDLLFFSTTESGPSHVGIAIGGNQFVHAPSSTGVVRIEQVTAGYWARRFIGARRVAATES
jgi:cell wall-associated NlpC family hydrolase